MNILYINTSGSPDYQADAVYHGLKRLYGIAVESLSDMWYMYDSIRDDDRRALYGKGFTLYGNISRDLQRVVTHDEALGRLQSRHYSFIIYGSIRRSNELLDAVSAYYAPGEVAFIDGEDETDIQREYFGAGLYFKRELGGKNRWLPWVRPISFAIPKEKIIDNLKPKYRQWATNYPGRPYTYIYNREVDYYEDYRGSKYAVTCKKAGWDCLRHYEILANGCLLYFIDIENCPHDTLTTLPKTLLERIKVEVDQGSLSDERYDDYAGQLLQYTRDFLTTECLASYLLDELTKLDLQRVDMKRIDKATIRAIPLVTKNFCVSLIKRGTLFLDTMHKSPHLLNQSGHYEHIFIHDHIKSASRFVIQHCDNITGVVPFTGVFGQVDEAVLEFNLSYQEDLADYFIWLRANLKANATVKLVVPNAYRWLAIRSLMRGELVGDAYLSNKPIIHVFTPKQITRLLKGMGFGAIKISGGDYTGNWLLRKIAVWLPVVSILHSKLLLVECRLDNEIPDKQ
ncbi:hypothetical protein [Parapedobacter sp. DT-150]|uniref:hypothetical protein n=1 Tax=Parapedobacter sp. DT-150 TaxID=3396162 RepID=UPI003F1D1494